MAPRARGPSDLWRTGQSWNRGTRSASGDQRISGRGRVYRSRSHSGRSGVPLVAGIVDEFRAAKRKIVGPAQDAAQLEGSKIHSKEFMRHLGIPTARYARVESVEAGIAALAEFDYPVVIKADGLAAGKGVIIAQDRAEAEAAVRSLGPRLVIEEFLEGEEVSFIALSDGKNIVPFEATQDHKAVGDGDTGPNTGGMGAYCDGRILASADAKHVLDTVIGPVVEATKFTGFLYAGLMMTADGPKVLEFNVRLGDPETQPLMHRLDSPFGEVLMASATGNLAGVVAALEAAAFGVRGAGRRRLSRADPNRRSDHRNSQLRNTSLPSRHEARSQRTRNRGRPRAGSDRIRRRPGCGSRQCLCRDRKDSL